ncbi:MAG: MFS transporter, partial [Planctomycetes bacterium]|nr:MFS transporter [Planctomycetota bacterium]
MSVRDIESNEGMSCDISVSKPSRIRIAIAAVLVLMACLLYLDRFAVGIASEYIREDVRLTQTQMSWFLSVFFWAYALSQVPSGWLSDRFGKRLMLTVYILLWSVFTGWLGLTYEVWIILLLRLLCGAAQAGAFPVCGGLLRAWFPISQRGVASSIVALGGRTGGVLAPLLTAWLIIAFTSQQAVPDFNDSSFLDTKALVIRIHEASTSDHPKLELLRVLYESFPSELKQQVIHDAATLSAEQLTQPKLQNQTTGFRWRDIFQRDTKTLKGTQPESLPGVVQQLNLCLNDSKFVQTDRIKGVTLPKMGLQLLKKQQSGKELESKEYRLLNRLAIETALPQLVPRFYG